MKGNPQECVRRMLMRCLLVWIDVLSVRDLATCRFFCMDNDVYQSHMILALGYSLAPTTLQQQLLVEILETMKVLLNIIL